MHGQRAYLTNVFVLSASMLLAAEHLSANPMLLLLQGQQLILGQSAENPAISCNAIVTAGAARGNGQYWLKAGSASYLAYCDMTVGNPGWTLVMRSVSSNLAYANALWTDTTLSNETVFDFTTAGVSKYQAYLYVPFTSLRSSDTTNWSTSNYTASVGSQTSVQSLFSNASGIQLSTTLSSYWNSRAPANNQQWGCTTYVNIGINQLAYLGTAMLPGGGFCDWNGGARFGQRVNAYNSATGNHVGQGWGNYSTAGAATTSVGNAISQLMWVK
jgi:hypothetical protein